MTILEPASVLTAVDPTATPASTASPTVVQLQAFVRSGGQAAGHDHGRTCYWDFRDCRWVCMSV